MLVHSVIFWLKKDLSPEDRSQFEKEVLALEEISTVDQILLGKPAATTKRPVIDDTYDFFLTVILKDVNAHDQYQEDSIHLEFISNCSHMWERVKIYDAD
jgi:hypothetical protein